MPLTTLDEPAAVDPFGVRFVMAERDKRVPCHVFRSAINHLEDRAAGSDEDLLARFQRSRALFERLASDLYDAGHRTPWIEAFGLSD